MPDPADYDNKDDFVSACIGEKVDEGVDQDEAVGACHGIWDDHVKDNGMKDNCEHCGESCTCGTGERVENVAHALPGVKIHEAEIRTEELDGRTFRVAPVIPAVGDNVMNEALVPTNEWARSLPSWNGRPLPVNHPEQNGMPISANDPAVLERANVGFLFNARLDDDKFKAEIWIDEDKAQRIAPDVLTALDAGQLEVSTAYFADDEPEQGEADGKPYRVVHRNLRPDHVALLPNTTGACSWHDGCGAPRTHEEDNMSTFDGPTGDEGNRPDVEQDRGLLKRALDFVFRANRWPSEPDANQFGGMGTQQIEEGLMTALETELDKPVIVQTVFPDTNEVVYEVMEEDGPWQLVRRGFTVDDDGNFAFNDDGQLVQRVVQYEPINDQEGDERPESNEEDTMDDRIKELIENEAAPFGNDDAERLQTFEEKTLDQLVAHFRADDSGEGSDGEDGGSAGDAPQQHADAGGEGQTVEQFIENAPAGIRDQLRTAQRQHDEHRGHLIKAITANERNVYGEDELRAKDTEELEKLARFVAADFSGRGAADRDGGPSAHAEQAYTQNDAPSLSARRKQRRDAA